MSEFDFNEIEVPEGLLELNNDSHPSDLYINNHLKIIDDKLLEGLAKKLSYSDAWYGVQDSVWANISWRKAIG